MKILFITKFFVHDNFGRDPLGILYLSKALKIAGHITDIADASTHRGAEAVFNEFKPDIIAFSVTTSTYKDYISINGKLKKLNPNVYTIFGGPHCTFYPEFFENEGNINAICTGEAEEAIVDFVGRIEAGEDFENTLNFHVRKNGRIIKNSVRNLTADINTIAFPDRDLLKRYSFVSNFSVKTFISSRGCPYDCTYCYNYALAELYKGKGNRVRFRSVNNLLNEICEEIKKRETDFINFDDDIFGMNIDWLKEFSEKYPSQVGLPFCCNVRVEYINKNFIGLLKRSGCHTCVMGIENGNSDIRINLLNRNMSDEAIINACRLIRDAGITLEVENILGLPGVSYEQEKNTVLLNIKCGADYPASYLFQPQPKTLLGDTAIKKRLFNGDYSKMGNYYKTSVLANKDTKHLLRLRSLFFFIVRFPILYRFMDILVSMPINGLYYIFHAIARGYMARFRIMPYRFKLKEFIYQLYRYFLCN